MFRDIDNVPVGVDFRTHIQDALEKKPHPARCGGAGWHGPRKGADRIEEETDQVRIEIETALKSGIAVIPVLVGKTEMPKPADLPESLKALCYRNAIRIDPGQTSTTSGPADPRDRRDLEPKGSPRQISPGSFTPLPRSSRCCSIAVGFLYFARRRKRHASAVAEGGRCGRSAGYSTAEDNPRIMEYSPWSSPLQGVDDDAWSIGRPPSSPSLNQAGIRAPQSMDRSPGWNGDAR